MPEAADILATVNGQTLTFKEGQQQVARLLMEQRVPPQSHQQIIQQHGPQLIQQIIERFIDKTLLSAEAVRREIPVDEKSVDKAVKQIIESLPAGMDIETAVASQGTSLEAIRKEISADTQLHVLFDAVTGDTPDITDEDILGFYKEDPKRFETEAQVAARHILIKCDTKADETLHQMSKAKAESVQKKLVDGADFAEQAGECSDCPSKEQGGELGTFGRGKMAPEFEEAAFAQAVDEIGPVVKTPFGYHIIQVTGQQEAKSSSLEEVSSSIKEHLEVATKQDLFQTFAQGLREGADIQLPSPA